MTYKILLLLLFIIICLHRGSVLKVTAFTGTAVKAETGTRLCALKIDILLWDAGQVAWPHQASVSSFVSEDVHMGAKVRWVSMLKCLEQSPALAT